MDLTAFRIFLTVAEERSFSRAAAKVHRTQPAVSQAVKRLEDELGEQLFDRSSKSGTLTDAGRVLQNYGQRLVRLAEEAESAMRELRDLRRGRVLIGANEAAIHTLLPLMARFRQKVPDIAIDVRRVPARQIAVEVQQGSLDFGALTFRPAEEGLLEVVVGSDELVLLMPPSHPVCETQAGDDGGSRRGAGGRAQRSVARTRAGTSHVRGTPDCAEHGDLAAESRRNQARRRAGARGRALATPLRRHRNCQRPPGRRTRRGNFPSSSAHAGVPQGTSVTCGERVSGGSAGENP